MNQVPTTTHPRRALYAALLLPLGLALAGCASSADNRQLESVHQPVVSQNSFTLDITTGPGGISNSEQHRLAGWFEAMDLRYGDHIAIDDPLASDTTRAAVETVVARYGLLLGSDAPVTPGYVNAGTVRIVLTRATATVPHCPDWSERTDTNLKNATSRNYGCATNSNIAAMVADPNHLLKGASSPGTTSTMSSNKAIDAYRKAAPTGEATLKQTSSKGS